MNIEEYKKLYQVGFLDWSGSGYVQTYWDRNDAPYRKSEEGKKVVNNLIHQLDVELDYNNIIILFPLATGYGINPMFGQTRGEYFPIDHCTYYLDIKDFLHKQGIVYKNNISLRDEKYRQSGWAMLVVQDGIAYVFDTANPLKPVVWKESFKEIKYNQSTDKHLRFNDKEIIFSGFFVNRIRKFDKDAQQSFSNVLA